MGKGVAEYPQIKENKGKGHLSSQVGVEVQQITHPWAGERKFRGEGPPPSLVSLYPKLSCLVPWPWKIAHSLTTLGTQYVEVQRLRAHHEGTLAPVENNLDKQKHLPPSCSLSPPGTTHSGVLEIISPIPSGSWSYPAPVSAFPEGEFLTEQLWQHQRGPGQASHTGPSSPPLP